MGRSGGCIDMRNPVGNNPDYLLVPSGRPDIWFALLSVLGGLRARHLHGERQCQYAGYNQFINRQHPNRARRRHGAGVTPTLDSGGSLTFNVGADLRVKNNQAIGPYSSSYTITVNYQCS